MPSLTVPAYPTPLRALGSGSNTIGGVPSNLGSTMWSNTPGYVPESKGGNDGTPVTDAQVRFDPTTGQLPHNAHYRFSKYSRRWLDFEKLRAMRRDPTISLARETAVAPIIGSTWSSEITEKNVSEEQKVAVDRYLLPYRQRFMRTALLGEIDFGWRAYEKVFVSVVDTQLNRRIIIPNKIKPLLNDNTWARYSPEGDFDGLLHSDPNGKGWFSIDYGHSLFANFDDDGLGNYNDPRLMRVEGPYDEWHTVNNAAKRFDEKVAGAVWVVHYPTGMQPEYKGEKNVDNHRVAQDIVYQIKASGHLIIPSKLQASVQDVIDNLGQPGWKIELIEAGDHQHAFTARLEYLDKQKIRGLGVLERAITEGNYGTKAEAESHINLMLLNMQLKHEDLTDYWNREVVDQFTYLNWGVISSVKFIAQPLADARREVLTNLFTQLLTNPESMSEILSMVNVKEIVKDLKIPMLSDNEIEQRANNLPALFKMIGESMQQPLAQAA